MNNQNKEKISSERLQAYLEEILACEALELHQSVKQEEQTISYYIPYMMNDAMECYLLLTGGRMVGEFLPELQGETSVGYTEYSGTKGLIFRQGEGNVFTLWFEECFRVLQCYRYDQIGHFWVEGQEQWRRLVYMIGTMHDKYHYMGEPVCNEQEKELASLMHFGPFRYYSPVNMSLDDYYEDTKAGLETMRKLTEEAGDRRFLRWLDWYERLPFRSRINGILAKKLNHPARCRLYEQIAGKVQNASSLYASREYPEELDEEIRSQRQKVGKELEKRGFSGEYPLFYKGNLQVLAMEEHPFVVLESEYYKFRIQFMVSETKKGSSRWNEGFFEKMGNRGWIARDLNGLCRQLDEESRP